MRHLIPLRKKLACKSGGSATCPSTLSLTCCPYMLVAPRVQDPSITFPDTIQNLFTTLATTVQASPLSSHVVLISSFPCQELFCVDPVMSFIRYNLGLFNSPANHCFWRPHALKLQSYVLPFLHTPYKHRLRPLHVTLKYCSVLFQAPSMHRSRPLQAPCRVPFKAPTGPSPGTAQGSFNPPLRHRPLLTSKGRAEA